MKVFTASISSLIMAMFLSHTFSVVANEAATESDSERTLQNNSNRNIQRQKLMQQKRKRNQFRNNKTNKDLAQQKGQASPNKRPPPTNRPPQKNRPPQNGMAQTYTETPVLPKDLVHDHDDWKTDDWKMGDWDLMDDWQPKNDWKGSHKHKHEKKRLVFVLDGCMYNYTNSSTTEVNLATFPPSGTIFSPRDFISASCNLFYRTDSNMYYAPIQAGKTDWSCFVTRVTDLGTADNDGEFLCTITSNVAITSNNNMWSNHKSKTATLISTGTMVGWGNAFKSATTGGTGGGIGTSGQLSTFFDPQMTFVYYIDAPYIDKGFPW
uniref:Uncharacterized protein n=1 Tax=Ditylum brightwellii TaxID=49249 RepID=A0A7S4QLG5_9STRA